LLARVADRLATGVLLIVGWEGEPEVVEVLSDAGRTILDGRGEDLGPDPGERWFGSRHAVSYKLAPIFERGGFADTMEVACSWGQVEHLYEAVRMALRPHAVVMAHMSHVYPEGCSIYFSFAGKGERAVYDATWAAALDAALQVGGTVTHHHGVGTLKAGAVTREVGAAIRGWEQAKAIFDPANVLNRGVVYTTSPDEAACAPPAGPLAPPGPRDGLVRLEGGLNAEGRADGASASGMELMWPWESLPAPARWHRLPWQIPATAVEGTVEGIEVQLGRAPRSAAGPDLRRWLFAQGAVRHVHMAAVALGPRWMGSSSPPRPWRAAFDLLRADLRPSVLTVQDGRLIVGFRGVAAAALGSLASRYVPGGLDEVAWQQPTLPSGELMACDIDRPDVVAVLPQGALRRRSDVS
jgi:alkyldihydroxyacetonephosphate synthase